MKSSFSTYVFYENLWKLGDDVGPMKTISTTYERKHSSF